MNNKSKWPIIIVITVVILLIVGIILFFALSMNKGDATDTQETSVMSFVDAHGNWYEFTPDADVKKTYFDKQDFQTIDDKKTYTGNKYKSRAGIDVSEHNGVIDWNKVKNSGVDFAIIRIGGRGYGKTGNLYADKKFDDNYRGAKDAGLDVGCYFFSQAINEEEAREEARFVLSILGGRKLDLPIVYDPESILDDEARTDGVSGEQFTANCIAFFDEIDKANNVSDYSYTTMLYANMLWEAFMLDLKKLPNTEIWYADYEMYPQTPYHYTIWQYSEKGSVPGVDGIVDLDIQMY